jgi:5-methylcytosine-specific restriction protein A
LKCWLKQKKNLKTMSKITQEMIEAAYKIGKEISLEHLSLIEGLNLLESSYGMNRISAENYIRCYKCMVLGQAFTRNVNLDAINYYLQGIFDERGKSGLSKALSSLQQYIDYQQDTGKSNMRVTQEICDRFSKLLNSDFKNNIFVTTENLYPDEFSDEEELIEGTVKEVKVNIYERNPIARHECIKFYGASCRVCQFNFEDMYGEIGKDFIHVHHIKEISSINQEYRVDPIRDLIPVCPNCHAMLHRRKPAFTIEEMKAISRGDRGATS